MNPHNAYCAKRRLGWDRLCTCQPAEPLAPWEVELLSGEKPNPVGKIHDRIAELDRAIGRSYKAIGKAVADGQSAEDEIAQVKINRLMITELRNVLGWL